VLIVFSVRKEFLETAKLDVNNSPKTWNAAACRHDRELTVERISVNSED
jgi:hypothetical protein